MRAERKLNKFKMAVMYRIDRGEMLSLIFCFITLQILTCARLKRQYITQALTRTNSQQIDKAK
jgi:hypothetical protein